MHPTLGGTDLPIAALPVKLAFTTGQKAKPVLLVLLARRDRQGRRAHRVLPYRLEAATSESALRVTRSNCQAATCRGECNEDEVLIVAYCGPRRSAVTLVNERTATCPRGAATSPLVVVCAKAAP